MFIGLNTSEQEVITLASDILTQVKECQIRHEDSTNGVDYVTVSIGCASDRLNSISETMSLLGQADKQLYNAKKAGKNCFVYKGKKYS